MNTENAIGDSRKNVLICDTQPVAVEGMKWLIENSGDLRFAGSVSSLDAVYHLMYPETARITATTAAMSAGSAGNGAGYPEQSASEELVASFVADASPETANARTEEMPSSGISAQEQWPEIACEQVSAFETGAIDAVVIDKGLGFPAVMNLLQKLAATSHPTPVVVWGAAVSEAEALRLLQAGARGILRRTSESGTLLTCLRAVTRGGTWMEDGIFGSTEKLFNPRRSQLTHRESEVVVLVEKGLRNRDIARALGIQTGTVKIHLKHIFEKTGVRGRYGLAFTGLQNRGSITLSAPPHFTA